MNSSQTIGRSLSRKHYHEQSMDDFMKNIKQHNMKSQRYIKPKPISNAYYKNNANHKMEKSVSRTLSNNKSPHSKSKRSKNQKQRKSNSKIIKSKLEKIFQQKPSLSKNDNNNIALFIEKCGLNLKKSQKYLQGKNSVGMYLCQEFLLLLNQIVEKMVKQLDRQLRQIEEKTEIQLKKRYEQKMQKMKRKNTKIGNLLTEMSQKLQNNSKVIHQIRMLSIVDVDYLFGKTILGTQECGGFGYSKKLDIQQQQISNYSSRRHNLHDIELQQNSSHDEQIIKEVNKKGIQQLNHEARVRRKADQSLKQLKKQMIGHFRMISGESEQVEQVNQQQIYENDEEQQKNTNNYQERYQFSSRQKRKST